MDDPTIDGDQMESEEGGQKKGLTRGAFLGHAAVGAAAVGIGSTLLGAPAALADTYSTSVPKTWSKTYDVVVIGTGVGLAAAIEAKKAGASVLILEKADHVGGLYITAGGSFSMGGNNVVQQAAVPAVVDSEEQWFQDEMYCTDYRAQPELVRTLVQNGADTVKWFQDLGIVYAPITGSACCVRRSSAASRPCRDTTSQCRPRTVQYPAARARPTPASPSRRSCRTRSSGSRSRSCSTRR